MQYLDDDIGWGLHEVRLGLHPARLDEGDPSQEDCTACHRPRDGYFQGTVGSLRDASSSCPLCHALIRLLVGITQEPNQRSHPFRLEVRKGVPAILHVCVAATFNGGLYYPRFARYQVFFMASKLRLSLVSLYDYDKIMISLLHK